VRRQAAAVEKWQTLLSNGLCSSELVHKLLEVDPKRRRESETHLTNTLQKSDKYYLTP